MDRVTLMVEGMSCGHCVNAVKNALLELNGISDVDVSLEEKRVSFTIEKSQIEIETVKEAIREEGYTVI